MHLGPRHVSASRCFTLGLSAVGLGAGGGCYLLPAPRQGSKRGAEPIVESRSQERKGWLTWVVGRLVPAGEGCQPTRRWPWGTGTSSQSHGSSHTPQHPLLCACGAACGQQLE